MTEEFKTLTLEAIAPSEKSKQIGSLIIVVAIIIYIVAFFLFISVVGFIFSIFLFIGNTALWYVGQNMIQGSTDMNCPYCNTKLKAVLNTENIKCTTCEKLTLLKWVITENKEENITSEEQNATLEEIPTFGEFMTDLKKEFKTQLEEAKNKFNKN